MRTLNFRLLLPLSILASAAALTACEQNEGTFEEAGEEMDQAVEEAKDNIEDAKDNIKDATN